MADPTTTRALAPDAAHEVHVRTEAIRGWTAHLADGTCTVEYAVAGINGLCGAIDQLAEGVG